MMSAVILSIYQILKEDCSLFFWNIHSSVVFIGQTDSGLPTAEEAFNFFTSNFQEPQEMQGIDEKEKLKRGERNVEKEDKSEEVEEEEDLQKEEQEAQGEPEEKVKPATCFGIESD